MNRSFIYSLYWSLGRGSEHQSCSVFTCAHGPGTEGRGEPFGETVAEAGLALEVHDAVRS